MTKQRQQSTRVRVKGMDSVWSQSFFPSVTVVALFVEKIILSH